MISKSCLISASPAALSGEAFRVASEAQRIRLAHLFDPYLAVHSSRITPLPHQITAVYRSVNGRGDPKPPVGPETRRAKNGCEQEQHTPFAMDRVTTVDHTGRRPVLPNSNNRNYG